MKLMRVLLSCFFVLAIALGAGSCGKKANRAGNFEVRRSNVELQSSTPDSAFVTLQEAITEVKAVPEPEGADEKIFTDLKAELERLLKARGVDKFPSGPPTYDPDNVPNLTLIEGGFQWFEGFVGDFDNDGWVRAKDLSPIAVHFGAKTNPADPNYWKYAQYVDGNKDGTVNAGDLAPIAFHFAEGLGGYNIYQADDATGTNKTWVRSIRRPSPLPDPANPPAYISYADLEYNTITGDVSPSPLQPVAGKYYMVAPFDRATPWQESTGLSSSWVQFTGNLLPNAVAGANPTSGTAPLTVNFTAAGSSDPDGTIVLYEWDFETDGTYDYSDPNTGDTQHTYTTAGNYRATLRVTDNDGGIATAYVDIPVTTTGNQFPVAVAGANPTTGDAPLTVNFDATGSNDPDGQIVLYEWDFTDDGAYDFSSATTGDTTFIYEVPGPYIAKLRVTDDQGATATDLIGITVNAPGNQSPVAVANANPTSGIAPLPVNFSATGSNDPDGAIILYEWDFETDGIPDSTNTTGQAQHTYNTSGPYTATLKAIDNDGATTTDTSLITVKAWSIEVVDSVGTAGYYTSVRFDLTGNACISYNEDLNNDLKFARWNGTAWDIQTVDSIGYVGDNSSLAIDSSGNPAIAYARSDSPNRSLKIARWNGSSWDIEVVEAGTSPPADVDLAFDTFGNPAISYVGYEAWNILELARYNGANWNIEVVDPTVLSFQGTSLAFDASGNPAISYRDYGNGDLKFARWNGTNWLIEVVDSTGTGRLSSLAFDFTGQAAISYDDGSNSDLKFAWWDGTKWNIQTVDSPGVVGDWNSLAFDLSGNPAISYNDATYGDLKLARWDGSTWLIGVVDYSGDVGRFTSLAFDSQGNPAISYQDYSGPSLKFASVK